MGVKFLNRWFTRYSGWGAGQLQRECASGVWFTAAASSALVLQQGCADSADSGREMWHQVCKPAFTMSPCVETALLHSHALA